LKRYTPSFPNELKYWQKLILPKLEPEVITRFSSQILDEKKLFIDYILQQCEWKNSSAADNAELLKVIFGYRLRDHLSIIRALRDNVFPKFGSLSFEQVADLLDNINKHKQPFGPDELELQPVMNYIADLHRTMNSQPERKKQKLQKPAGITRAKYLLARFPCKEEDSSVTKASKVSQRIVEGLTILKSLHDIRMLDDHKQDFVVARESKPEGLDASRQLGRESVPLDCTTTVPSVGSCLKVLSSLVNDYIPAHSVDKTISILFELVAPHRHLMSKSEQLLLIKCILIWECRLLYSSPNSEQANKYSELLTSLLSSEKISSLDVQQSREMRLYAALLSLTNRPTHQLERLLIPAVPNPHPTGSLDTEEGPDLPVLGGNAGRTQVNTAEERVRKVVTEMLGVPVRAQKEQVPILDFLQVDIQLSNEDSKVIIEVNGMHHYTSEHYRSGAIKAGATSSESRTLSTRVGEGRITLLPESRVCSLRGWELVRLHVLSLASHHTVCVEVMHYSRTDAGDRLLADHLAPHCTVSTSAPRQ
jgi:hypothetical protein